MQNYYVFGNIFFLNHHKKSFTNLKTASSAHERLGADEHHQENGKQRDSSGIGTARNYAKQFRLGGKKPRAHRVIVMIDYRVVNHHYG